MRSRHAGTNLAWLDRRCSPNTRRRNVSENARESRCNFRVPVFRSNRDACFFGDCEYTLHRPHRCLCVTHDGIRKKLLYEYIRFIDEKNVSIHFRQFDAQRYTNVSTVGRLGTYFLRYGRWPSDERCERDRCVRASRKCAMFVCLFTVVPAMRLIPIDIDLCKRKNMEEHSTIYYDIDGLVLRRGRPFSFTIAFNRDFQLDDYHLAIVFQCRTWRHCPEVKIPCNGSSNNWTARRVLTDNEASDRIHFEVYAPCDAPIGKYSVRLEHGFARINDALPSLR